MNCLAEYMHVHYLPGAGASVAVQWVVLCVYSVDEMQSLLADDDKFQALLSSRIDEVNNVQQKVVLFLEKFASKTFSITLVPTPALN